MSDDRRPRTPLAAAAALSILLVACSGSGASPSPASSGGPTTAPTTAPTEPGEGVLEHATGATDVLLRYEEGGGFVMPAFAATLVPHFTLYGDGTIVFRDPSEEFPPAEGSVFKSSPMKTAKLTEEQIQDVLRTALEDGGLAIAKANYDNQMIADASTALFTITVAGQTKTVSVYALGIDVPDMADAQARAAFLGLAQTLTKIDEGGAIETTEYVPAAYRGILMESPGVVAPDMRTWPWPDIEVADFQPDADPNGLQFPNRTMTPAEVEILGVDGYEGGFMNMILKADDAMTYTFSLRPLLPDETE
jgi:hypothetical protein